MSRPADRRPPSCLIIAAGKGSRLAALGEPKPLVPLAGRALLDRVIGAASEAGVAGFTVVTGYLAERIRAHVAGAPALAGLPIRLVHNERWERENGLSVSLAAGHVGERFVLLMSDHLFDPAILARLLAEPIADDEVILAVDRRITDHPTADLDDVTRVLVEEGRIAAIGKHLPAYNAFDTGIFLGTAALFAALEESFRAGDYTLSGGMRVLAGRGKARVFDIGDGLWIDVDDEAAYARAEKLFT